jgi:hypothetical protein
MTDIENWKAPQSIQQTGCITHPWVLWDRGRPIGTAGVSPAASAKREHAVIYRAPSEARAPDGARCGRDARGPSGGRDAHFLTSREKTNARRQIIMLGFRANDPLDSLNGLLSRSVISACRTLRIQKTCAHKTKVCSGFFQWYV